MIEEIHLSFMQVKEGHSMSSFRHVFRVSIELLSLRYLMSWVSSNLCSLHADHRASYPEEYLLMISFLPTS